MIVADTSSWIELLRNTQHPVATTLEELINGGEDVGITEVIVMELLAGVRTGGPARELRSRLLSYPVLPIGGLEDFEEAAMIYRTCRDMGHAIRSINDCLITVSVLRGGASLLHNDKDFDVIARHTGLKIYPTN